MKKFFLSIVSLAVIGFATSCSSDESEMLGNEKAIDDNTEITKIKSENDLEKVASCDAIFYEAHPSFDNEYQFDEPIVISWDGLLCGNPTPSHISIKFRKLSGVSTTKYIEGELIFEHKTNPDLPYRNYIWFANDPFLEEGVDYKMMLVNDENNYILDEKIFSISGQYSPSDCNIIVDNYVNGDYRVSFDIDNGNDCYTNTRYLVDFGDGTTLNYNNNNNDFTISHQYPEINTLYNVSIKKYSIQTKEPILLSETFLTVRSKRD